MELIRVEEKQLIIAEKVIEKIKELETKRKLIDEKEKEFKSKLEKLMQENKITGFESNDKSLKITFTPPVITDTLSSKVLQEKYPDIYRECLVRSNRKGSVRITIREGKEDFKF